MRKILIFVLLLIVGCSKPIDDSLLIDKGGLMYLPSSDRAYTGKVYKNYKSGNKEYEGTYRDGRKISVEEWNEDGSVKE